MAVTGSRRVSTLAFEVQTAHFKELVDVSLEQGGNELAPDPHEYLEIALAGCTSITLMMYAKRKNFPLEDVNVQIQIVQEGAENKLKTILDLKGDLTHEQKTQLLAIAEKCPIHMFLKRGASIATYLDGDPNSQA